MRRVAAVVAGLLVSVCSITGAQAHAELISMSPAAGSVVAAGPAVVTLSFGEAVAELGSTVVVLDPQGNHVERGTPIVNASAISIDVLSLTVVGTYRVNFRVIAADGHVVSGSERFEFAPADDAAAAMGAYAASPSPEVSLVKTNNPTVAYWMTAFILLCLLLAGFGAFIARRAKV